MAFPHLFHLPPPPTSPTTTSYLSHHPHLSHPPSLNRWYRDPSLPVGRTEITRFPHAVLEVKLSLAEGETAPAWVTELIESGMLTEVHKFSKFIHGTCTLFPDMVQAVPYWVDDESVRPSMLMSAPAVHPAAAGYVVCVCAVVGNVGEGDVLGEVGWAWVCTISTYTPQHPHPPQTHPVPTHKYHKPTSPASEGSSMDSNTPFWVIVPPFSSSVHEMMLAEMASLDSWIGGFWTDLKSNASQRSIQPP